MRLEDQEDVFPKKLPIELIIDNFDIMSLRNPFTPLSPPDM